MAVTLGSAYYNLKKELKEKAEREAGKSSTAESTKAQDEQQEIRKRHQKVLEARAKLHLEAGVGFLARFKNAAEGGKRYLVHPRVLSSTGPGWSFPGGGRLLLSLDLKEGSANILPAERVPSYVSLIKDSWQPFTGDFPKERQVPGTVLYWKETGLAEVVHERDHYSGGFTQARNFLTIDINYSISAAHAMYRMLCLFPSLEVDTSDADFYKCIWEVILQHKPSGFLLRLSEHKASLRAVAQWSHGSPWEECFKSEVCALVDLLMSDACLHPCGVVAGSIDPRHLDHFKNPEEKFKQYRVDPQKYAKDGVEDKDYKRVKRVRKPWIRVADPDRSERGLKDCLDVTVDLTSEKVCIRELEEQLTRISNQSDPMNSEGLSGTDGDMVPLCAAISSGLLLYRLLAIYGYEPNGNRPILPVFVKPPNPAESLWYTELKDRDSGLIVRIGDSRGAAAVWIGGLDTAEVTDLAIANEHLKNLVALLCSPKCPHTYDGTVAGCIA
ncbi:hypothetical protein KFL_000150150 [Klebsormidium nitens]|uniref:Uncharacterized protein n=1 Tax=Klebsormidium nitens TaxID=105231 RepID=A0A1Y1HKS5_KLENI|nr:hypothetical protein KFL_000150150 [Klebsormidium nitens]|eukprot:GAQ78563.1 hypothetical protein KFL_000150150 [Klebsormidium nitens]